jgi:hypothetical protein
VSFEKEDLDFRAVEKARAAYALKEEKEKKAAAAILAVLVF